MTQNKLNKKELSAKKIALKDIKQELKEDYKNPYFYNLLAGKSQLRFI